MGSSVSSLLGEFIGVMNLMNEVWAQFHHVDEAVVASVKHHRRKQPK